MNAHAYNSDEPIELLTVLEFIKQFQYPIDKLYIDRFWASINNDDWVVVDHEMLQWIGYNCARASDNKKQYIRLLDRNFVTESDYKQSTKGNIVVGSTCSIENIGLIVQPKVFKQTLMMLHTEKAKQFRENYLALEQVMIDYLRYANRVTTHNQSIETKQLVIKSSQLKEQVEQYKIEMNQLKSIQDDLSQLGLDTTPVELSEYVYILTSRRYYPLNLFKIGKTINLKGRLSTYNTGNVLADDEQFYLCSIQTSDSASLEKQLHSLLKAFLYRKEWYRIHTFDLLKLVQFVTDQQEASKVFVDQIISTQTNSKPDISLEEFMVQTNIELPDHSGYKMKDNKYFCSICNKDYIKLGGMMNHINSQSCKESKVGSFECPWCNKLFAVQHNYDKHVADNNCIAEIYTCKKCSKDYSSKKCYDTHVAEGCVKKFPCDQCGVPFATKYSLLMHTKRKTPCTTNAFTTAVDTRTQHSVYKFLNQLVAADYGTVLASTLYNRYVLYCGKSMDAISKCALGLILNKHGIKTIRPHKGRSYVISSKTIQGWNTKYLE